MKKINHHVIKVDHSRSQSKIESCKWTRRNFLKVAGIGSVTSILPVPFVFGKSTMQKTGAPASLFVAKPEKAIATATGEIFPSQMGFTSVHEHIQLQNDPVQREKSMRFAIEELKRAKELGLQTIVNVGPGADVAGIREVSLATGVNVICATGFYILKETELSMKVEDFENHMRREIEGGIQGTNIRPGVIKVATKGLPIKPAEENLLIAAAHMQKRYNLTICTHAVSGCAEQQQILEHAGADLGHCYFSHVEATFGWGGRTVEQEIDYLQRVVEKGSTLSFNNFGNWNHTKPGDLARIIQELTKRGYDDMMVVTMDVTWSFKEGDLKILWEETNEEGKDRNYSYLIRKVVPWLEANGLSKKSINKFTMHNPRRLFTW